jgi:Phage integrase family
MARALDAQQFESVLRKIEDLRDRTLFWLIYDGGLRDLEALAIDIEDIPWSDRSILIHGKGDCPREIFFSRAVGTLRDKYLATRGYPTEGPLFVTHRKARLPRRADLTADGYARLSYRQADTLWFSEGENDFMICLFAPLTEEVVEQRSTSSVCVVGAIRRNGLGESQTIPHFRATRALIAGFERDDHRGVDCQPVADVCRLAATLRNISPGDVPHIPVQVCLERC